MRTALAGLVLVAVTGFAACDPDVDGNLDLYHEGERLAHLDAFRDGALPFRDFFVPHGLGEDVWKPWLATRLFGDSVASLRRLGINHYGPRGLLPPTGLAAIALAGLALLGRWPHRVLLCALLLVGLVDVTDRQTLGFLAIAVVAARRTMAAFALAGVLAGLAMLYSLEVGLLVGAALALFGLLVAPDGSGDAGAHTAAKLGALAAGAALVLLPFLLWCLQRGILPDLGHNLAIQLFWRETIFSLPYPTPSLSWETLLFFGMPACYAGALALWLVARHRDPEAASRLLLATLLGAGLFLVVPGRPDLWHVAAAAGAFTLFAVTLLELVPRLLAARGPRLAAAALPCAVLVALAVEGGGGAARRFTGAGEPPSVPRSLHRTGVTLVPARTPRLVGLRLRQDQARYLDAVVEVIQRESEPDDTLLDLSNQGLFHYLAERRAPSRYHFVAHAGTPALRRQLLAEVLLAEPLPRLALLSGWHESDPLGRFVARHYRPVERIGLLQVLRCDATACER